MPYLRGSTAELLLGRELRRRGADPLTAAGAVNQPGRDPIRALLALLNSRSVLEAVPRLRVRGQLRGMPLEPGPSAVGVDRGVRGDLRPIDGDRTEPGQAGRRGDQQHLRERIGERLGRLGPEPRDRGVIRAVLSAQHPERDVGAAQPLDLS